MPFEKDRFRMQREEDGTYTAQLPCIWTRGGYVMPVTGMDATKAKLDGISESSRLTLSVELDSLEQEKADVLELLKTIADRIQVCHEKLDSDDSDIDELIDAGYDAIEAFDFDNRYTKKHGQPTLVFVTPWDKDRDGKVEFGEFEICYGWGRYNMPESEG